MSKVKNRIEKDYSVYLKYKENGEDKSSLIKLFTLVISKRGYKPRNKKSPCDTVPRIDLQDPFMLSVMINENIKDTASWMSKNDMVMLYRHEDGTLDLRRDRNYLQTSLLHFETDVDLNKLDKLLDTCTKSIMESIAVNIPCLADDTVMIYQGGMEDYPLPVGKLPSSLGISCITPKYLPIIDVDDKFEL